VLAAAALAAGTAWKLLALRGDEWQAFVLQLQFHSLQCCSLDVV